MGLASDLSRKLAVKPGEDEGRREMEESCQQKTSYHVASQGYVRRMGRQMVENFVVAPAAKNDSRAAEPEEGKAQLDMRPLKKQAIQGLGV